MARRTVMQRAARLLAGALAAYAGTAPAAAPRPVAPEVPHEPLVPAAAPGLGHPYLTPRNQTNAYNLAASVEALFGKVSSRLGPTNPRWSTFQGEMNPEGITGAIDLANAGTPYQLQDMYRRAVEHDGHLGGIVEQRIAGIISKPDRIEPPEQLARDPLAISCANWMRAVREQIDDFDESRFALLWADGAGYMSTENIYGWRRVVWFTADGRRISKVYLVPVKLDIVDARGFRFDTQTDEPLLWLQGDYIELPPAKFVFHRSFGFTSLTERRGFMRSCIWLHAMKGWTVRDMNEFLAAYGLPQLIAGYDPNRFKQEEANQIARDIMEAWGQLKIPVTPEAGFNLRNDTPPTQGALVHRDAATWYDAQMTKRVTLGPLVMEQGSGYGLGDVHAEGALDGKTLSSAKVSQSIRRGTFRPAIALNKYRLAEDLGAHPDEIMAVVPMYSCRIQREETPESRQKIFSQAMKDGLPVSKAQYRHDLHIDEPHDEGDTLLGEAVSIPSAGAVAGAVDASKGLQAPAPAPKTPPAPPSAPAEGPAAEPAKKDQAAAAPAEEQREAPAAMSRAPQADPADPGVYVGLIPPTELAQQLMLPGGEPAAELHCTLAYLGRRSELPDLAFALRALGQVSAAPLEGVVGGVIRFPASDTSGGMDVLCCGVDVPGLVELRQQVVALLQRSSLPVRQDHGFTPHITLAYLPPSAASPVQTLPRRPVQFDAVYLCIGEERHEIPLGNEVVIAARGDNPRRRQDPRDYVQSHPFWVYRASDAHGSAPSGDPISVFRTEDGARMVSGVPTRIWHAQQQRWID